MSALIWNALLTLALAMVIYAFRVASAQPHAEPRPVRVRTRNSARAPHAVDRKGQSPGF